ncbi:hypothetical protein [Bacillus spongiae]
MKSVDLSKNNPKTNLEFKSSTIGRFSGIEKPLSLWTWLAWSA